MLLLLLDRDALTLALALVSRRCAPRASLARHLSDCGIITEMLRVEKLERSESRGRALARAILKKEDCTREDCTRANAFYKLLPR